MRVVKWNDSTELSAVEQFTFNQLNEMLGSMYGSRSNDSLEEYRRLNINSDTMMPAGPLDISSPKYPTTPRSESFALKSENGLHIRFVSRGNDATANFMMGGRAVVAHIGSEEYEKAKNVYREGRNRFLDNLNVVPIKASSHVR